MPQIARFAVAFSFGMVYFGLTVEYLPQTVLGFVLTSILFLTAVYPTYRVANAGSDSTFIRGGVAFVALATALQLLKPQLPVDVVRYSGITLLLVSIVGSVVVWFRQRGTL